jgi:hypothetical protein
MHTRVLRIAALLCAWLTASPVGAQAAPVDSPTAQRAPAALELERVDRELEELRHPVGLIGWGVPLFGVGSGGAAVLSILGAVTNTISGTDVGGYAAGAIAAGAVGLTGLVLVVVGIVQWVEVDRRRAPLLRRRDELRERIGPGVELRAEAAGLGLAF